MGILQIFAGNLFEQGLFYRQGRFSGSDTDPVADPENVGIHRDGGLPELGIEDDIRGFAPDPGQGFQRLALGGYLAMMPVQQLFSQGMDMPGFGIKEAETADMLLDAFLAQGGHAAGIRSGGKQGGGTEIDDFVGTLGRQYNSYQ